MNSQVLARAIVTFECYFLSYTFAFAQQMVYYTIKAIVTNMYKTSIKHVLYMFNTIMNLILASFSKEVFFGNYFSEHYKGRLWKNNHRPDAGRDSWESLWEKGFMYRHRPSV